MNLERIAILSLSRFSMRLKSETIRLNERPFVFSFLFSRGKRLRCADFSNFKKNQGKHQRNVFEIGPLTLSEQRELQRPLTIEM
jgi:hypothetical protein